MEKNLIILRGLPNAGKTTVAKLFNTKAICCADDYHTHNNVYDWKPENIKKAHEWCQKKCRKFMKVKANNIVIANTNTTEREMKPYFILAKQFSYKIFSLIVENRHGNTNDHNVPESTILKMNERFEIKL